MGSSNGLLRRSAPHGVMARLKMREFVSGLLDCAAFRGVGANCDDLIGDDSTYEHSTYEHPTYKHPAHVLLTMSVRLRFGGVLDIQGEQNHDEWR